LPAALFLSVLPFSAQKIIYCLQVIAARLVGTAHFPCYVIDHLLYLLFACDIGATGLGIVELPFMDEGYPRKMAFDRIKQWRIFTHAAPIYKFLLVLRDNEFRNRYLGFALF
jgi:hypothetical protein